MSQNKSGGTPWFLPALTLVFVLAKLFGHFDYSWWWVFAPMWIPLAAAIALMLLWWLFYVVVLGVFAIYYLFKNHNLDEYNRIRREQKNNRKARKAIDGYVKALTRRS